MQLRLLFISILIAFSASTVTALPYGAYVVNDVTAYNDCPLCNSGEILTGSICTCPALATSIQNFRILNDCGAPHSLYRGAFITLCDIPDNSSIWGGGYQINAAGTCRYGNPITGNCSCPAGFLSQFTNAIVDGLTQTNIVFCYRPKATLNPNFGGSFQLTDSSICLAGNPFALGGACACPSGYAPNRLRVLSTPNQGSYLSFCFPPIGPAPPGPGTPFTIIAHNDMVDPTCVYNGDRSITITLGTCYKTNHNPLPSVSFKCVNGELAIFAYQTRVDPYCEGAPLSGITYMPVGQCVVNQYLHWVVPGLDIYDIFFVAPFCGVSHEQEHWQRVEQEKVIP